jgi:PAS domain-containing protein
VPIWRGMDACHADSDRELAFLRAVIDHAHAGIVATDALGAIVLWNRVFERCAIRCCTTT